MPHYDPTHHKMNKLLFGPLLFSIGALLLACNPAIPTPTPSVTPTPTETPIPTPSLSDPNSYGNADSDSLSDPNSYSNADSDSNSFSNTAPFSDVYP